MSRIWAAGWFVVERVRVGVLAICLILLAKILWAVLTRGV